MAKLRRRFPNIEAVTDPRSKVHRGWRAVVWVAGRSKRGKTRETQELAYGDAQELLGLRARVDDDDPDPTLKTAILRVLATLEVKGRRPATTEWFKHQFEVIKREWPEETKLRDIDRRKVQAWIEKRTKSDKVSPNTVGHHLRALRRIFRVANLPSPTSDSRLIVPDSVPGKVVALPWNQVKKKLASIQKQDDVEWGMVGFVAYTGIRRSELARLRISDVDLDDEVIHVRHAKVAKLPRSLPMPKGLQEMAACAMGWGERYGGKFDGLPWLIPGKTEDQRVEFLQRLSKRWDVKLHVLRHSFASELARRGVAVHVIARLLGHSMGGTTMRYVHEAMPELRAAMEKLWEK